MQLAEAIQQLAGTKFLNVTTIVAATVASVNVADAACQCRTISGKTTAELITVSLMAESDDGLLLVPAVGSTVLVAYNKELLPFIIMYSELDEAYFWVNNVLTLKDGQHGGLVMVTPLTQKLNALENKVNQLLTAYNAHTHAESGSTTGPPGTLVPGTLTPTQQTDIENPNVTHG